MKKMDANEIKAVLDTCAQNAVHGVGSYVHFMYHRIPGRVASAKAIEEAKRADDLGIEKTRYTGQVERIWKSKAGDLILTLLVTLERADENGKPVYRAFNIDKGELVLITKMQR